MTSLLPARGAAPGTQPSPGTGAAPQHRRPLVLVSALGGAAAALATLAICLTTGVVGWYLADSGTHGAPRGGLRVGALAWLMAHGSGLRVHGTPVSVVPLALTLLAVLACWRVGVRVGDAVSGHGPDADRIADGERDWTVPAATTFFAGGYAAVAALTLRLAGQGAVLSGSRALLWCVLLGVLVGGPAIAVGSGRLAVWSSFVPDSLRASIAVAGRVLLAFLVVSTGAWLVSLGLNSAAAANVMSQLHLDAADSTSYVVLSALVAPNASLFAGSYLLGPGFAVGTGTLISPTAVVVGALPLFPLLAALPGAGPTPAWAPYLMLTPLVVAAIAGAWAQRRWPTARWGEAALRGSAGGVIAGVLFAAMASLSGGQAGPGRMRVIGPVAGDVLVHAVPAFALGGLIGALVATWWRRRRARRGGLVAGS